MAITRGHGNPKWTREEVILALELYLECSEHIPSASDSSVRALSELLRAFPHHSMAARKVSFRNPDGVAFKLQNLRQIATGKGLGNVSQTDRAVWEELGATPSKVKALAALIKTGIHALHETQEDEPEYEVFAEGRIVTEVHLRRERSPKLRARLIEQRSKESRLLCELCGRQPHGLSNTVSNSIFEAHHTIPLATGKERLTKLSDLALLCACCRRMVHKAIATHGQWLTIPEAKKFIYKIQNVAS